MRSLMRLLTIPMMVLGLGLLMAPAASAEVVLNIKDFRVVQRINLCNGETVDLIGDLHFLTIQQTDDRIRVEQMGTFKGTGSLGNVYEARDKFSLVTDQTTYFATGRTILTTRGAETNNILVFKDSPETGLIIDVICPAS